MTTRALLRRRPAAAEHPGDRWPLGRLFAVGAAVLALLAVAAITLGGLALSGLTASRAVLLDRVSPALDAAQRLSVALLDQETGVRGYSLTGRPDFLEPFRTGVDAEAAATAELRGLVDQERLTRDVEAVSAAAQRWRESFAEPAVAAVDTGAAAPDPLQGRTLFDQVRVRADVLLRDLTERQREGRAAVTAAAAFLQTAAVAVAVLLVLVLVAAAVGLRRTVLGPVSDLAAQVRSVVSGDADQRVHADGPREILELGADVEAMRVRILADLDRAEQANRRLAEQGRELERSNRDLEQFAYVASHDLQEPLRKVSSFCQLLQRRYGGQLDDRADQYIEFAVDGAQRMQRLINDLLAFSRVGRTTEGFVDVPLADVAAAAAAGLETTRSELDGEIVVGSLPTISGDPQLLRQLLANLIGNGLKFHREGVPPVVHVTGTERDGEVELRVSDNGIGIEPEYEDKIFVIFQRLHARDVYAGTGIGLSLAKKIAEFHGGTIRVVQSDGPGATVAVVFPPPSKNPEELPA
ncbi:ATP-binding protein [Pseudonocardia petroleophila]|uniref:histidine kinase n=1 Tax=Pseudonocardia petroleophila TaxID=37331 RepID=A0A7G7ML81_9PSEU|nr:sensor histidine kinase [Pseudonocardia petroleophila]QNG53542.1 CHASE3 domain-containing protein [Pseudonocardia petroleophila]